MTGSEYVLTRVHHAENEVHRHLAAVAERHRADHEIHHVSRDLARWSRHHVRRIAAVAAKEGMDLDVDAARPGTLARLGDRLSYLAGRRPEPALLLLEDLRDAFLLIAETSLAWEMLAQFAQAARRQEVLSLAQRCHPQTLRQQRWCNTMIKTLAPQALTSL